MSKHNTSPPLSPEKYIRTRARTLPLGFCYVNEKWQESGMAFVLVTRKHVNGNLTFGGFQVDLHCLGVKDAFCNFNFSPVEINFGLNGVPAVYLGKEQHPQNIIAQLERSAGSGNFLIMDPDNF